mmetsp:Transcript_33987/g.53522  ORF Transcript_33987/g.53522 Transcript_33987/m.53522 type:complete len:134 (+) Transcript_33987:175-576(+)
MVLERTGLFFEEAPILLHHQQKKNARGGDNKKKESLQHGNTMVAAGKNRLKKKGVGNIANGAQGKEEETKHLLKNKKQRRMDLVAEIATDEKYHDGGTCNNEEVGKSLDKQVQSPTSKEQGGDSIAMSSCCVH